MTSVQKVVPLGNIKLGRNWSRESNEPSKEFLESIKTEGLIVPLIVRPLGDDYELVAGFLRYSALKKLEVETVNVVVRDVDDANAAILNVVENEQRKNLNSWQLGKAARAVCERYGLSGRDFAARIGKSQSYVSGCMRLEDRLHPDIAAYLDAGSNISANLLFQWCSHTKQAQLVIFNKWKGSSTESKTRRQKPEVRSLRAEALRSGTPRAELVVETIDYLRGKGPKPSF